jgi:hypothetical protein
MADQSIYVQLSSVQSKLNAPKNQFNKFGNYAYRSCEDILGALKPLLAEHSLAIVIKDSIEVIGTRVYIKADVTLYNGLGASVSSHAYAREAETKKGMDEAQITGSASSYARKYALNALFAIDDSKDADATNTHDKEVAPVRPKATININYLLALIKKVKGKEPTDETILWVHDLSEEELVIQVKTLENELANKR